MAESTMNVAVLLDIGSIRGWAQLQSLIHSVVISRTGVRRLCASTLLSTARVSEKSVFKAAEHGGCYWNGGQCVKANDPDQRPGPPGMLITQKGNQPMVERFARAKKNMTILYCEPTPYPSTPCPLSNAGIGRGSTQA